MGLTAEYLSRRLGEEHIVYFVQEAKVGYATYERYFRWK